MATVYPPPRRLSPSLALLAGVFARDANLTFGGGSATAETLRRKIVERRRDVSDGEFRLAYAASRLTPGTNLFALCSALGWRMRGTAGALVALAAASIPSVAITAVVMAQYEQIAVNDVAAAASRGAVAAASALLVSSAWALIRPSALRDRIRAIAIVVSSWWLFASGTVSAVWVLAAAAVLGAMWPGHRK
jgi:chromate transporter